MEKEQYVPLVRAVQNGDTAAADALFGGIYQDVYYFILKTVKDATLAEDLTQDSLIEIFQNLSTLRDPVAFPAWCRQIAYFRCTRHFRKKKEVLVEEDEEGGSVFDTIPEEKGEFIPEEALNQKDFRKTVMDIVDSLSEEQRSAVLMYYFEERSVSEIAVIQGVSEGTVKSRLNYGRRAIKKAVEDYEKKTGTRLHAVPFLPLLHWVFSGDKVQSALSEASAASLAASVSAGAQVSVGASLAASSGAVSLAGSAAMGLGGKIAIGLLSGAILAGAAFGTVKLVEQVSGEASVPVSTEESAGESGAAEPTEEASPEAPVLPADTEVVEDGVKYTDFRIRHDAYGNPIREVSATAAAEKADESVTSLSIRNSVEGYRVTRIEKGFGRAYPNLKELTLSCEVVSESAFVDCTGLESVTLTKGVKLVEERAFYNLNQLSNITIDPSVTRIWGNAFDQTGYYLNEENWQGDLLILGDLLLSATGHVSATDYVIPEGVRTLAIDSFSATGGVWLLESSRVRIPYSLENGLETSSALCYLSLILPEDHPVYRLEGIWVYRRSDGALAGVLPHHGGGELPKDGSLKNVGAYAFFAVDPILGRMELEMPDSVVTVEDYAFYEGESIQLSHLPTSLRTVGRGAFRSVAFLEFEIPRSLETVGAYAFEHCGLEGEVLIPNTLRNLERDENGNFYPIFFGNDITLKLEADNPAFEEMEEEEVIRQLLGK